MIRDYKERQKKGDLMIMKYNFDKIPNRRGNNIQVGGDLNRAPDVGGGYGF